MENEHSRALGNKDADLATTSGLQVWKTPFPYHTTDSSHIN